MNLPTDLLEFLKAGRQLSYDAQACDVGQVVLLPPEQLKVRLYPTDMDNAHIDNSNDPHFRKMGCYLVPGVSLLAECDGYDPDGLLLWFPEEQCYGTWDSSHNLLEVFSREVSWTEIAGNPVSFLNSFWDEDRIGGLAPLIPWPKYPYDRTQPCWPRDPD